MLPITPEIDRAILDFYNDQLLYGGSGPGTVHRGSIFHRGFRGHGFGSIIAKLFKVAAPLLKAAVPGLQTTGKYLAKTGLKAARGLASDMISGVPIKEASKRRAARAFEQIKTDFRKKIIKMVAPPLKRKKKQHKILKRRRYQYCDNFS